MSADLKDRLKAWGDGKAVYLRDGEVPIWIEAGNEIERLERLLDVATHALGKVSEFYKYEPAGPAAATAQDALDLIKKSRPR